MQSTSVNIWTAFSDPIFNLSVADVDLPIIQSVSSYSSSLSEFANVRFGVKVYQKGKGRPKQTADEAKERRFNSDKQLDESYFPYVRGRNVDRWSVNKNLSWLKYGPHLAEPRDCLPVHGYW